MHPHTTPRPIPTSRPTSWARPGETVTYGELDARSNQGAHLFRSLGIEKGDSIALFMDNTPRYYEVLWAAQRSGLRFTAISSKLTAGEVEYIVGDCEAKALVCSKGVADVALQVAPLIPGVTLFMIDGAERALRRASRTRGRSSRPRRSPTRGRRGDALFVGHHRAAEGGEARRSPASAADRRAQRPLRCSARRSTDGRRTASISRPRRSIMPRRSAGRWRCWRSAARWW